MKTTKYIFLIYTMIGRILCTDEKEAELGGRDFYFTHLEIRNFHVILSNFL
jgi:hypothetical protein